jgi:hypothetical protein
MPEPVDYTDPNSGSDERLAAELKAQRLRDFAARMLADPAGREWIWGVLAGMKTFEETLIVGGTDQLTGYERGRRDAGLGLMRIFAAAAPDNFGRMFQEHDR